MISKKLLVCRNERFERPSRRREENDVRPAVDSDRRRARPDWLLSARPLSLVRRASSPSASSSHSQSPTPASTRWRVAHEPPPYTRENDSKKKKGEPRAPNSIDRPPLFLSIPPPFFATTFSFLANTPFRPVNSLLRRAKCLLEEISNCLKILTILCNSFFFLESYWLGIDWNNDKLWWLRK